MSESYIGEMNRRIVVFSEEIEVNKREKERGEVNVEVGYIR